MSPSSSLLFVSLDTAPSGNASTAQTELHAKFTAVGVDEALALWRMQKDDIAWVIADIGDLGEQAFPLLESLGALVPASQTLVTGNNHQLSFYRLLRQKGIAEYFPYPLQASEVLAFLRQQGAQAEAATPASAMPSAPQTGQTFAFMSAASGDGSSTVAINTAYCLAEEFRKPTVLVDMDYQFGIVARQLDLSAPYGMRELFEFPDRGLDDMLISRILVNYKNNLRVIAAPEVLRVPPVISPESVRELIGLLNAQFTYTILDIPHIWSPWTSAALSQATRQVVIAQQWLRSLTHLTRLQAAWKEASISRDRMVLGINRSGAKFKEAITPQDFERVSGKAIDFYLPNDIKTIVSAENQGKTVFEIEPSPYQKQIRKLVEILVPESERPKGVSAGEAADERSRFGLLRGLKKA